MSPGSLQLVHKIILGQFQLKIRSELWSLQPVMKCLFPDLLLCCSSRQPKLPSMSYSMIEVSCPPESIVFTLHHYLSPFSFHPTLSALHVLLFACAFWKYIPFKGPINNCGHNMRDNIWSVVLTMYATPVTRRLHKLMKLLYSTSSKVYSRVKNDP